MTTIEQLHKPRWQEDGDNWLTIASAPDAVARRGAKRKSPALAALRYRASPPVFRKRWCRHTAAWAGEPASAASGTHESV
jgi:hypothetical protein